MELLMFLALCFIVFVVWWKTDFSFIAAGITGLILFAIFEVDFSASVKKLKELDTSQIERALEEGAGKISKKVEEIEQAAQSYDDPSSPPVEKEDKGFSVKITIDNRTAEQRAADELAAKEEAHTADIINEMNLQSKHITGYIREAKKAKLYVDDNEYTLVTPEHGTMKPNVFLLHSDGRLFVGKGRRVWPVGAD